MLAKLCALLLLFPSLAFGRATAIRAGHLVDPATGSVKSNQVIVVQDGTIISVSSEPAVSHDAEIVDLSAEWVTPGLMDAHTHLTLVEEPHSSLEALYLRESSSRRGLRGLKNAEDLLRAGFTTIRDVGNDADYSMQAVRQAIQRGWFDGPTILSAGKIIAPFGGQSDGIPEEQGAFWRFEYLDADSPAEVRKAVRRNIYYGADLIKLVADNSPYYFSFDEIRAAVDEAHRAGRTVAVHVMGGQAAQNAIDGGVDSIEHGFELTDSQLQEMKAKGIFLVGTDLPKPLLDAVVDRGGLFANPAILGPQITDRLRRAYRIGVKMAFGTDETLEVPNKTRAELMLEYLSRWKEAGIPNAVILKSMTTSAAELLAIQAQRGAIAPGQAADIIAMPTNPLDEIESLRHVNFVMKNGKIVRCPQ
jgi:imidazolonepropionase-like amidohydrolase